MFRLYYKRLHLRLQSLVNGGDPVIHLHFKIFAPLSLNKSFSSKTPLLAPEEDGFVAVSYLTNSWGLSPETALSLSKKVNLKNPEHSDRVLSLLGEYGFTDTQITNFVKSYPKLLSVNIEKNLLPKLEFFQSIGVLGSDLAQTFSKNPLLLANSLNNTIVPFYNILKSELVIDQNVAKFFGIRRPWHFLNKRMRANFGPNIAFLRSLGVPDSSIVALIMGMGTGSSMQVFLQSADKFRENVEKVNGMGFDRSQRNFANALEVVSTLSKSKWAEMREIYRKCCWTEDDFLFAFRRSPVIMKLSTKNVTSKMDLLVNKMGWKPADIARCPYVLHFGLENWIVPRCSVIEVLLSKELIEEKPCLSTLFVCTKQRFLKRFVTRYLEQVPELLSTFDRKTSVAEIGLGFKEKCD